MSQSETDLVRLCLIEASRCGARLFRQNTGHGWIGDATKFTERRTVTVNPGDVLIRKARPFHAGFDGLSDMGGWRTVIINPRMVDQPIAQYVATEAKTETGHVTLEQRAFMDAVTKAGGLAGVIRSVQDMRELLSRR